MRISDWSSDVCSSDLFLLPTILARRHVSALAKPAQERLVRKKPEPLGNRTDRVVAVMQTLAGHRQPHPVENFAITSAEFLQIAMQTARAGAEQIGREAWRERVGQDG